VERLMARVSARDPDGLSRMIQRQSKLTARLSLAQIVAVAGSFRGLGSPGLP